MIQSLNNKIRWLDSGKVISNVLLVEYNLFLKLNKNLKFFLFGSFQKSHYLFEIENFQNSKWNSNENVKFYFFSRSRIRLFKILPVDST